MTLSGPDGPPGFGVRLIYRRFLSDSGVARQSQSGAEARALQTLTRMIGALLLDRTGSRPVSSPASNQGLPETPLRLPPSQRFS